MIRNSSKPSKQELLKEVQATRHPIIESFDVFSREEKSQVIKSLDNNMRYGHFRVIILRER